MAWKSNKQRRAYYWKNREDINQKQREYYFKNRDTVNQKRRNNYAKKKGKYNKRVREYRKKNRRRYSELQRIYTKKRRRIDPKFRLDDNMRNMVNVYLRGKKARRTWEKLTGYTIKKLMEHLEAQFDENMTWDNYGSYWHVDHIKPKSLFNYTYSEDKEFKKCWGLKNLQPLEARENLKKSNKFV